MVGVKVTFVAGLPGEDCEQTGDCLGTAGKKNDLSKLMWLKGKKKRGEDNDWITITNLHGVCVCVRGCKCVLACVFFVFFFLKDNLSFINSAGHVPAREITFSGEKR